jgi:thioesterase domain-containing protein
LSNGFQQPPPVIYLPGSGGGTPDLTLLRSGPDDPTSFQAIRYPGWQRLKNTEFSADGLIADLASQIEAIVPSGPIRILGLSIGGHFGYAAALHLQAKGREIAGFCALDSFMFHSAAPGANWQSRAIAEGLELIRKRRMAEFFEFLRSKFWRAFIRLPGTQAAVMRPSADPILEQELSMRLLVTAVAPWLASLDDNPVPLNVPAAILRTPASAGFDEAWRRRCPRLRIFDLPGTHHTLFEPENIGALRAAFAQATKEWQVSLPRVL